MTILNGDFAIDCGVAGQRSDASEQSPRATSGPAIPDDARLYLRHVEEGVSIRALAREAGCHASTIMRRIRRFEARRDDPLVDGALSAGQARRQQKSDERQILRVLRRLAEPGSVLATADGMDKAIVTRGDIRTAVLDRHLAEDLALRGWVAQEAGQGRIQRYVLVPAGRAALRQMLKSPRQRDAIPGPDDFSAASPVSQPDHGDQHRIWDERVIEDPEDGRKRRVRVNVSESPLLVLARRRDGNGQPFLTPGMVAAGERLREDFELAHMGPRITQNWDGFMTSGIDVSRVSTGYAGGSVAARNRVAAALRELGPGMGDIVLRVCCFLEGIEMTERRLGWSARSGKIVLRLALMRLERHYQDMYGSGSPLIG